MPALETDVKGSPGTCQETADWLRTFAQGARTAADAVHAARAESDAAWEGPAGNAFRGSVSGMDGDLDRLHDKALATGRALEEFSYALDRVASQMAHAREVAQGGGLEVSGTVILPPKPPGPPPLGTSICTQSDPAGAQVTMNQQSAEAQAHQRAVDEYNARVRVFNDAKHVVEDARKAETDAHAALERAMKESGEGASALKEIGTTVASRVLDAVKGTHEQATELLNKSDEFSNAAQTYQKFATGNVAILTPQEVQLLERLGKESDQLAQINSAKAGQLEQWIKAIPEDVRKAIAKNPSTLITDSSMYLKYAKPYLKGMPYAGSALTILSEGFDVANGEKSVGSPDFSCGLVVVRRAGTQKVLLTWEDAGV
ncbi:hypothetical protein [Gandjariella thermophila]|uniref:Uncharacterized protein n=1 Tax=Gandjariella thermophila TaxID=1931992 RepID=A0A4D4JHL4_9PSEU|nr:hypothetical protein [Gandjariella thermophila]GDY33886.1 hypothetical protein GTS_55190 [Gandjariella thermophila]